MSHDLRLTGIDSPARRFATVLMYFRDEGFSFETSWAESFWRVFGDRWEGERADADRWADILTRYRAIWPEQWRNPGMWSTLVVALERIERQERAAG